MSQFDLGVFVVGWALGWLLLWRGRPLPSASHVDGSANRSAVAVVVPARNEADVLGHLLPVLRAQLRPGDELVVVDDHSTDETSTLALASGATVIAAPELPAGWLGKPNACWAGARATVAPTVLFVDADVVPAPDLLDRVATAIAERPDAIVSVQPWHRTVGPAEQASLMCNIAALMGSGAFTIAGEHLHPNVAFGPVLAVRRAVYERVGGHGAVRSMHTEDIGLARAVGETVLFTGRPDTAFRMYPQGLRQLFDGWTRSIATGARSTRPWWTLATACWITAIAGGWWAGGWPTNHPVESLTVYALSALQVWVLGRRAGSIHPLTALLFPLAIAVFVVIVLRSAVVLLLRRDVAWKGRTVASRGGDGPASRSPEPAD
ncbi:MAG: glycosyltransferase family 2 protein [Ilumatobacteraceae bacterium]